MCSRFYVDDSVDRLLRELDQGYEPGNRGREDVLPSRMAFIVCVRDGHPAVERMKWGFLKETAGDRHGAGTGGLVINARAETALERPMFRDSARSRRCMVPAAGFYEWNRQKEKAVFSRPDGDPLLMAGLCQPDPGGEGERFVDRKSTRLNSSHPK